MSNETVHVLLVYSLREQKLVEQRLFQDDSGEAIAAYLEAEREHLRDRDMEIVLIGAQDLETIETTHGSYWRGDVETVLDELERLATS